MSSKGDAVAFFILGLGVAGVFWSWGLRAADDSWRQQIADHGCAEFYLDQDHDRQWRWKGQP